MGVGAAEAIRETAGSSAALLAHAAGSHPRDIFNQVQIPDTATVTGNATSFPHVIACHDRTSAGQYVPAGARFDTVIVTVTY
jgi:spore coat protein U-like protein